MKFSVLHFNGILNLIIQIEFYKSIILILFYIEYFNTIHNQKIK